MRLGLKALTGIGLWLIVVVQAGAVTDTLDQQSLATSSSNQLAKMAQTFTAGMTGRISRVSLFEGSQIGAVTGSVSITGVTSTGQPDESVVYATNTFAGRTSCCTWFDFTFATGAPVTNGSQYAIVVKTTVSRLTWWDNFTTDAYPGGKLWLGSGSNWISSTSTNFGKDFAFKTWVAGGTNSAPTIGAANSAVIVNEGAAQTNTGTYSDPDGDSVAVRASVGTVTKTGTSSGSWSWTRPVSDEGPTTFVTITADDGNATAITTFSVAVNPAKPRAWIRSGPTSAAEGSAVTLTGYGTSPSAEDTAGPWTYTWNVTKNGSPYGSPGNGASFSFTPDDDGAYVVSASATDDGNITSDPASVSIVGTNVAPTAAITKVETATPIILVVQQSLTFTGQFSDAGVLDSHKATWDFGDGTSSTQDFGPGGGPTDFTATHGFAAAKSYTVTLTVVDKDGGSATATYPVTIQTIPQALGAISNYLDTRGGLTKGEKNSLEAKLNAAAASYQRGDTNATCNQLDAFFNELDAKNKSGNLSADDYSTLTAATRTIQFSIGCFKDLTSFLSGL